jgi:hypothetical protein
MIDDAKMAEWRRLAEAIDSVVETFTDNPRIPLSDELDAPIHELWKCRAILPALLDEVERLTRGRASGDERLRIALAETREAQGIAREHARERDEHKALRIAAEMERDEARAEVTALRERLGAHSPAEVAEMRRVLAMVLFPGAVHVYPCRWESCYAHVPEHDVGCTCHVAEARRLLGRDGEEG